MGNDWGIIVPSTVCRDGVVWRYYRSGEMAFTAKMPHQWIPRRPGPSPAARLDLYTRAVLAAEDDPRRLEGFVEDTELLVGETETDVVFDQAWWGEVTEMADGELGAAFSNVFDDALSTYETFPVDSLPPHEREQVAVGSTVVWYEFERSDPAAPDRASDIRLLLPAAR